VIRTEPEQFFLAARDPRPVRARWRATGKNCSGSVLIAALASCVAHPHAVDPVTGQRPTLSSDTGTAPAGQIEIEIGATLDPGDAIDTPALVKYGLDGTTEVFAGASVWRSIDAPGGNESGVGDSVAGFRHRFLEATAGRPSAALQAAVKLPTADEDRRLGSGEPDLGVAAIATQPLGGFSVTAYYELDLLGDPDGGADVGHVLALLGVTPFRGRWSAFGELGAVVVPERDSEQVLLTLGATYNPECYLVLDFGVALGLTDDAPDFALVLGLTENVGHRVNGH
jgi:hypothetical protein